MPKHIPEEDEQPDSELEFIEPWRCGSCSNLMYNRDEYGYPTLGAPIGISVKLNETESLRVCLVCAEMYIVVLKSQYLREEHQKWVEENNHKSKLKSGSNYLDR